MKPYIKHLFFTFPVLAFHGFANFLVKLFDGQAWEAELSQNKFAAKTHSRLYDNLLSIVISALLGLLTAFTLYSIYTNAAQ